MWDYSDVGYNLGVRLLADDPIKLAVDLPNGVDWKIGRGNA